MKEFFAKLLKYMGGIKVGDIDIADQVLQNEYTIRLLLKIIDTLLANNPKMNRVTDEQLRELRAQVVRELQTKYPNMGIQPK